MCNLCRKSPLCRSHFFERLKTKNSSTACETATLKSPPPRVFSAPHVHPRLRKRLARCTLDCGFKTLESPALRGFVGGLRSLATAALYLVLLSNGFPYSKIRLKKFDFSPIDTPANIAKKLPSQRCSQPFLIAFSTSRTNGPRSLLQAKAGTHSAFRERSHTRAHAPKQGAFLSADTAWLCVASEIVTERTAGGSGCTPMACVRFLRRRGPAGLRDLIISLPTLRSLTFHVEFSYHTNRLVPPLSACTARC